MRAMRFIAIIVIFAVASAGWLMLGGTIWQRTQSLDRSFAPEMASQWGPAIVAQTSPWWTPLTGSDRTESDGPDSSDIDVNISHDYRYKGLLWYSTFTSTFDAKYRFEAASGDQGQDGYFILPLPEGISRFDLAMSVDGQPLQPSASELSRGRIALPLRRDTEHEVAIRYTTYGQQAWLYCPSPCPRGLFQQYDREMIDQADTVMPPGEQLTELRNFSLTIRTDFAQIDYPKGTVSPSDPARIDGEMAVAGWHFDNAFQRQPMGVLIPRPANAGPVVARMSFFAPVSLFFFFTVLFTVVVLKKLPLHPMHYLFISAGFFAFHILLAYLVDKVPLHASFWIAAATSTLLVVSYIRLVAGVKFAVAYVGAAQLVYLVGFSYAFFFRGWTGLTVVVVAIVTLFVLMQATGRVNWHKVFGTRKAAPPPLPPTTASAFEVNQEQNI